MITAIDLLERYYDAFINLEEPKGFFLGLADYLEFINSAPELDQISGEINEQRKPLEAKLEKLKDIAVKKLHPIKKDLVNYTSKNKKKIDNNSLNELNKALARYDGWAKGDIFGSSSLPEALHGELVSVIAILDGMPEHKKFASRYIEFSENKPSFPKYLPMEEYAALLEINDEFRREQENSLWGQLGQMAWLYHVIRDGRKRWKTLVEGGKKTNSSQIYWEGLNYKLLVDEWEEIEKEDYQELYFFKIVKFRPWVIRLNNYFLARQISMPSKSEKHFTLAVEDKLIPTSSFNPRLKVNGKNGYLQIFKKTKPLKIADIETRQYRLVKILFNPDFSDDAEYAPVEQSYERIFDKIGLAKDKLNGELLSPDAKKVRGAKIAIIEQTIDELQKKDVGKHLTFERSNRGFYRLNIVARRVNSKEVEYTREGS